MEEKAKLWDGICPKCKGECQEIETPKIIEPYDSRQGDCIMQCTDCKHKFAVWSIWYYKDLR